MSTVQITAPEIGAPDPTVAHSNAPDGSTGTAGPWVVGNKLGGFIFAKAGSAITAGQAVVVDQTGTANPVTTALSYNGQIAVANSAVASGAYAWFQYSGVISVLAAASSTANAVLYTSTTAGQLTSTSGGTQLHGIVLTAAGSTPPALTAAFATGIDV